jgi:Tfp pilus assembly protein PilX
MKQVFGQSGSALIVVLGLLLLMTLIGIQMVSTSNDDVTQSGNSKNSTEAFYSAEAGQSLAKSKLWAEYVKWQSNNPVKASGEVGSRNSYTAYLTSIGLKDGTSLPVASNVSLNDVQKIDSVIVARKDQAGSTTLNVASYGSTENKSAQVIRATYTIEGEQFKGFDFAILAKNVNCIMCHAQIDNVDRIMNTDKTKQGTFDRIKVAALESMLLRVQNVNGWPTAQSNIAGTMYTRGLITDQVGNLVSNLSPTGVGVSGYSIDSKAGTIKEPLSSISITNTTGSPLPANGSLYMNYPTSLSGQTDGQLPNAFPPPFPDDNGNKQVDDAEFSEVAQNASGSIGGGVVYGVATGGSYASTSLPGASNQSGIYNSYNGNLILVGTAANPIQIDGKIAVSGDVVIQGVVKGTGQIFAKGNVYVTGDVTYADGSVSGNRTFGTSSDGTQNALSLAAGKNILLGDYLTPSGGTVTSNKSIDPGNLSSKEKMSFTQSEMTLFNRGEWTKTQKFLPDVKGNMVANSTYDASYVPRYYTMNAGDPVYIYNKPNKGKGTYWDPASTSWQGLEHIDEYDLNLLTQLKPGDAALASAKTLALSS